MSTRPRPNAHLNQRASRDPCEFVAGPGEFGRHQDPGWIEPVDATELAELRQAQRLHDLIFELIALRGPTYGAEIARRQGFHRAQWSRASRGLCWPSGRLVLALHDELHRAREAAARSAARAQANAASGWSMSRDSRAALRRSP